MPVPDCSYVDIDDLAHPDGSDYIYCLQAEMRAMKDRMYNALEKCRNNQLSHKGFEIL